jgi:hypothetical protein
MKQLAAILLTLCCTSLALAQQDSGLKERRYTVTETAVALDAGGSPALEATLLSTELQGRPESAISNIRMVVKNSSPTSYSYASGVVTFYDNAGVRCGEGVFKADVLAAGESFETDSPGIRIRCSAVSWRIVATSLVPRMPALTFSTPTVASSRLMISIDGESHPIQLGKPMTLSVGNKAHTIVVREERQ